MIVCVGATHKRASVPMLESLMFKDEVEALRKFFSLESVKECVLLQTCNRVEIYSVLREPAGEVKSLVGEWSRQVGVSRDILRQVTETRRGREALVHLLRLASGLESMVVGEDQILGQIRKAFVESKKAGSTGLLLEKVFMKAINVGRRVRTETGINRGSVSISSVAVDLAEEDFGGLGSVTAFVVGAGEAGTIVAEELDRRGVGKLIVTNRTYRRGCQLAALVKGEAVRFEELYGVLSSVDLVFVAVSSKKPVIAAEALEEALEKREGKQRLLVVDISQPRAVEEEAGSLSKVGLRNIDDLKGTIEENLQKRWSEAERAKQIILEELGRLDTQIGMLLAEPLVSRIFKKVDDIRQKELEKALQMLKGIDESQRVVVEDLTKKLMEKMLQTPTERLREAALNHDGTILSAAEKLFDSAGGKE